jgi:hypothetical protein
MKQSALCGGDYSLAVAEHKRLLLAEANYPPSPRGIAAANGQQW